MTTYYKTSWINDGPPARSAANLNKQERGIADAHAELTAHEAYAGAHKRYHDYGAVVGGALAIEVDKYDYVSATIGADTIVSFTGWPTADGGRVSLEIINGGAFAITWPTELTTTDGLGFALKVAGTDFIEFLSLDSGSIINGFQPAILLDEYDMASNSNTQGVTQQSLVSYSNSKNGILLEYFGGTGTSDDTATFQSAFDYLGLHDNQTLILTKSNYNVSTVAIPTLNNITIQGINGTTITGISSVVDDSIFDVSVSAYLSSIIPTSNIITGDNSIEFNLTDISTVSVGDTLEVLSTKLVHGTTVFAGLLKRIKSISGTTVTFYGSSEHDLNIVGDTVHCSFYTTSNNVNIDGITFKISKDVYQRCVSLFAFNNIKVSNCNFYGEGKNRHGLSVAGFNITVDNIYAEGFEDPTTLYGYGVVVSGHNIKVLNSSFRYCKHFITGGNNAYTSTNLLYSGNFGDDPSGMAYDAHSSCNQVSMVNNTVVNVLKSFPSSGGFNIRGSEFHIENNTVLSFYTGSVSYGIVITDEATIFKISGNIIKGIFYPIYSYNISSTFIKSSIDNNLLYDCYIGIIINNDLLGLNIHTNDITSNYHGIWIKGGASDLKICNNSIAYSNVITGNGIYFDSNSSSLWNTLSVQGNTFKPLITTAQSSITFLNYTVDNIIITDNIVDTTSGVNFRFFLNDGASISSLVFKNNLFTKGTSLNGITSVISTFVDGDATPSVSYGNVFKVANTVATTITALDSGLYAESKDILFTDNNTTVDFTGTNLKGNNGADWSPSVGDSMRCIFDGTDWYCSVSNN